MFLIYISDLIDGLHPHHHRLLFADDSNFFIAAVDLPSATSIAQGLLDKVQDWCWSNEMALNNRKSAIVNSRTPEIGVLTGSLPYERRTGASHPDLRERCSRNLNDYRGNLNDYHMLVW